MSTQRYTVTPHPIETLLTWVKSGEIAIPEIQRPFVWEATKVRNLLDSLYRGYPVGYLIAWRNPAVKLKDGSSSAGKRVLISDAYWEALLPQEMNTSSSTSPYFRVFQAAQVKLGDKGFLSRDITVRDLILNKCDVHHLYPRNHLKGQGLNRGRYNQIANYALAQSEINIAIGDKAPATYFKELLDQCQGGKRKFGGITNLAELKANLAESCIPEAILNGETLDYDAFLEQRRKLMAAKIQTYFKTL